MGSVAQASRGLDVAACSQISAAVEAFMGTFLDERPLAPNLGQAVRYALLGGGKRLRPILVVRSCEALGGGTDQALAPAAAVEMIHAFSLVHDDLPAMDDDDLRRGRPTLHKHTSEAMAILAGDVLTSLAFEIITTRIAPPRHASDLAGRLAHELSIATRDMISGQVYDTLPDFDDAVQPLERLQTIHRHKTGALICASCRMGAIVAGARASQLEDITRFAQALGLMFQVVDDLLDVTQTTEHLGKAAGKDADQGKLTYPGLLGVDQSRREVQRLHVQACEALESLGPAAQGLRDLCNYMAVRTR